MVTFIPSVKPLMPEAAKSTGKQKRPAPVTWKNGTAVLKAWKFGGFCCVDSNTLTEGQC